MTTKVEVKPQGILLGLIIYQHLTKGARQQEIGTILDFFITDLSVGCFTIL